MLSMLVEKSFVEGGKIVRVSTKGGLVKGGDLVFWGSDGGCLDFVLGLEVKFLLSWAKKDDDHGTSGGAWGSGLEDSSTKLWLGVVFCSFGFGSLAFAKVPYLSTGAPPSR